MLRNLQLADSSPLYPRGTGSIMQYGSRYAGYGVDPYCVVEKTRESDDLVFWPVGLTFSFELEI